jgi:hypothetical protein
MEHHYGRHGPRAWLRWRQRRYGRPSRLPVPVEPQPTIVRVFVPTNAERIIFIVIQGAQDPNEENQDITNAEIEAIKLRTIAPSSSQSSVQYVDAFHPSLDTAFTNDAEQKADEDVEDIELLVKDGKFVLIEETSVDRKGIYLARDCLRQHQDKNRIHADEGKRLKEIFHKAYTARVKAGIKTVPRTSLSQTPIEARLRNYALQDRKERIPDQKGNYHKRDIAVVRTLQCLDIPPDQAVDCLDVIHRLADEYENTIRRDEKDEVYWPLNEGPFRR